MARYPTLNRLARYAEDQWGLVTRRQAEAAGVSRATLTRLVSEGILERVGYGVYHLSGAPMPDHAELRAAWLQLAAEVPAWERTPEQGVVSHRSAAALYGLGHLPADRHEFSLPKRRQTRQPGVRLHKRPVAPGEWATVHGLPVTRPSRIAADLLDDREDPEAVATLVADALRGVHDHPATLADTLARHAVRFGFRERDGVAVLRWLLDLVGDRETATWLNQARVGTGEDGARADASSRAGGEIGLD